MKLVKAGHEIITEKDPVKKIEKVARTCYKSEKRITEGSAVKMVRALVKHKHYAMLEHASIILESRTDEVPRLCTIFVQNYGELLKLRATSFEYSGRNIVSGNMRAWLEFFEACARNNCRISKDLAEIFQQKKYFPIFDMIDFSKITAGKLTSKYTELDKENLSPREMMVHYDLTVKFICDRGVSHEIVRHREASFAQESTRYCNYSKDKYGNEIAINHPTWITEEVYNQRMWPENPVDNGSFLSYCDIISDRLDEGEFGFKPIDYWLFANMACEYAYIHLTKLGIPAQEARTILPLDTNSTLVHTAFISDWQHFFDLRSRGVTGKPHPDAKVLADELLKIFTENGYIHGSDK